MGAQTGLITRTCITLIFVICWRARSITELYSYIWGQFVYYNPMICDELPVSTTPRHVSGLCVFVCVTYDIRKVIPVNYSPNSILQFLYVLKTIIIPYWGSLCIDNGRVDPGTAEQWCSWICPTIVTLIHKLHSLNRELFQAIGTNRIWSNI